jgi:hypothetical protein
VAAGFTWDTANFWPAGFWFHSHTKRGESPIICRNVLQKKLQENPHTSARLLMIINQFFIGHDFFIVSFNDLILDVILAIQIILIIARALPILKSLNDG